MRGFGIGLLAFACCAPFAGAGFAACPDARITEAAQVALNRDSVMLVTHASSAYDPRLSTKRGLDEALRLAKQLRIPAVYLVDDEPTAQYFVDDCDPAYWVRSTDGEVPFEVGASHVVFAGGHLELCLARTLHDVLSQWAKQPKRRLKMTFLMDAIYSNGKSIDESDRYFADFQRFIGVVTYGRPGGESWPKLTLLETMGIIIREDDELAYLTKVVPNFARTLPADYRVELQLNDSVPKVLRHGAGWKPPTLRFHFVDSAIAFAG